MADHYQEFVTRLQKIIIRTKNKEISRDDAMLEARKVIEEQVMKEENRTMEYLSEKISKSSASQSKSNATQDTMIKQFMNYFEKILDHDLKEST